MIYLASPYSNPHQSVKIVRYQMARLACLEFMRRGQTVFSPIVYGHQFHMLDGTPGDMHYWKEFNLRMIRASSEMQVLKLDGWEASAGVKFEIEYSRVCGMPLSYVEPSELGL